MLILIWDSRLLYFRLGRRYPEVFARRLTLGTYIPYPRFTPNEEIKNTLPNLD